MRELKEIKKQMSLQKMGFEVSFLKSELDFGIPYSAIKKAMGGWVEKEHCETGFQIQSRYM